MKTIRTMNKIVRRGIGVAAAITFAAGCSSTTDETTGTKAQAESTSKIYDIVPQDVTAVWWIAPFNPAAFVDPLCSALPECGNPCFRYKLDGNLIDRIDCQWHKDAVGGMLGGLAYSANWGMDPQSLYDNREWTSLKDSHNYRGFLKISNMTIRCQDDRPRTWDDGSAFDPHLEQSSGYTLGMDSELAWGFPHNLSAEASGSCVEFKSEVSSRVGFAERNLLHATLGINAPFIYANATVKVCCDGAVTVNVDRTVFPTMAVFSGGKRMAKVDQADLVPFTVSPGVPPPSLPFDAPGDGVVAPAGQSISFTTQAVVIDEDEGVTW